MQLGNKAFKMFCIVMDRRAKGEWQFVIPIMPLTTLIPLNDFPWHVLPMS